MKQKTLAIVLGVVLGSATLGLAQAQEQGIRPVPEDIAAQPVDERTEETMPYPEDSLQGADTASDQSVQDAVAQDDTTPMQDESDADTASTDISPADEAAAADALTDSSELPADSTGYAPTETSETTDTAANAGVDPSTGATAATAQTSSANEAAADTRHIQAGSLSSSTALEQALQTRFQSGDENGDGSLSQPEIAALDDDDLDFAAIDADSDGAVTREEWSAQLHSQVASADNEAE